MLLKGIEELIENILFCFLSHLNIWVILGVVASFQVLDIDLAVAISIESLKGYCHYVFSSLVHLSDNGSKELIIVDLSVTITVENSENLVNFLLILSDSVILHSLSKFLFV